jgi:membrane-bound lytic murein transglycosylase D
MKSVQVLAFCLLFLLPGTARTQSGPASANAPASSPKPPPANQADSDLFQALNDIDLSGVQDFFTNVQQHFDDTNIFELGSLKEVAQRILPVLDEYEETEPYAIWLKAHLDDFDAAREIQRQIKAAPAQPAGPQRMAVLQRSIWVAELKKQPWPPLAKTYLPKLKPIFVEEKVPAELVWVADVESAFDPRARSPAGAAGMFQLMPATARDEHLSLWPFDQRYQPEKSARAAAHYLHTLHQHYGDWPLTLAAYNVGEGRVDKLLKEHKVHSFDAVARWLPSETQMYVPKIAATVLQREGRLLSDL